MKLYLPLLSLVVILASCSTSYKSGQTPDDVYYSPERQRDEYARVEEKDDRQYQSSEVAREDRYLRMKTQYRRYATLDDCECYCYSSHNAYRYNDYHRYNSYVYFNNSWYSNPRWGYYNPYYYNPYYTNPYYGGYVAGNTRPIYNKPRTSNMNIYGSQGNNNNYNSNVPRKGNTSASSNNNDNYQGSGSNAGGFLRNVFGGSNSNKSSSGSSNNNSSSSSSNNSSSSSSGSSSSGSTSAPVRKF